MTHDRVLRFIPLFDTHDQATRFATDQALAWLGQPASEQNPSIKSQE